MKTLIVIILSTVIAGCSLFPQPYDNNEYQNAVNVYVELEALRVSCDTKIVAPQDLQGVLITSRVFKTYTKFTPDNDAVNTVAETVHDDILEMISYYTHTPHNAKYCEIKTILMIKKMEAILEVIPQKTR